MTKEYLMPKLPKTLPQPESFRLYVLPPKPREKSDGGIILSDSDRDAQEHFQYIGQIVAMGPACFKDKAEFRHYSEDNPSPKVGDWIVYGSKDGMKVEVTNEDDETVKLRLLADTSVLSRVEGPEGYTFSY